VNSSAVIDVCWRLQKQFQTPLCLQIWDDPLHILRQRGLDRWTTRQTLKRFDDLLQKADRVAVISEQMREAYAARTAAQIYIIRHGVNCTPEVYAAQSNQGRFVIGFSGAMYADTAWRAFQGALDLLGWEIDGRKVELIVLGSRVSFQSRKVASARFLGWRTQEQVIEALSACDLLYLPQSFGSLDEPLTRLSFPTKLSTYVATGRPVFLHTPEYGSLTKFSRNQNFGLLCNELNPAVIAKILQGAKESHVASEQARASRRIAGEVLSSSKFKQSVRAFLDWVD
jgi:hypothetical protein